MKILDSYMIDDKLMVAYESDEYYREYELTMQEALAYLGYDIKNTIIASYRDIEIDKWYVNGVEYDDLNEFDLTKEELNKLAIWQKQKEKKK